MNKLIREIFIVGIISFLASFLAMYPVCDTAFEFYFDAQNFLTWQYASLQGFVPYKDIFYPYGIFLYYAGGHLLVWLALWGWTVLLLVAAFLLIRRLGASFLLSLIFFFGLLAVLFGLPVDLNHFNRYGPATIAAGWVSVWIFEFSKTRMRWVWFGGVGTGIMFSLFFDQGLYVLAAAFFVMLWNAWLQSGNVRAKFIHVLQMSLVFLSGWFVGVVPFGIYLWRHQAFGTFVLFTKTLFASARYAKMAYLPMPLRLNVLVSPVLVGLTAIFLGYGIVFHTAKMKSRVVSALIGFFIVLFMAEYKNTIRPFIDNEFQMTAYFVVIGLVLAVRECLRTHRVAHSIIIFYCTLAVLAYSAGISLLPPAGEVSNSITRVVNMYRDIGSAKQSPIAIWKACAAGMPSRLTEQVNPNIRAVIDWLKRQADFNGNIFSYPADPVFYILLHQKPPPFFNAYDGTPIEAQNANRQFLQDTDVRYIVYKDEAFDLDFVPNVVRNNHLVAYMLTTYEPVSAFGQYTIFKRMGKFVDSMKVLSNDQSWLYKTLTNIDLGSIPQTQGAKINQWRDQIQLLTTGKSFRDITAYVTKENVSTDGIVLAVSGTKKGAKEKIYFTSEDGLRSEVQFVGCSESQVCVIRLGALPHFFIHRRLVRVETDEPFDGIVRLLRVKNSSLFW